MPRRTTTPAAEKQLPSIANRGYFSDYFLGYRLDAGLDDLYKRWDAAERNGDPTARTRVRSLSTAFDKQRAEAADTAPDLADNDTRLDLGALHADDLSALTDLNDAILTALGWTPARDETVELTSGDKVVHIPVVARCDTATGLLLVALETVFATDPATVVADKTAAPGTLLQPVRLGDKPEGRTVLEAAQLIFTADDAPSYILVCSGASITLLDRDRWGEGVYLGANLDDAIARGDHRARGELAAIAALFSADAINPGEQAQSVLTGLVDRAANESAGVSKDLRHGVRRSVEILANAVVHDVRHRQKGAWQQLDADELTRQCLRYLYRIIVLLYAEARPELGILPVDDPDYQSGYSVARLRDTALVELQSDHARNATHLQRSLAVLFRLVNDGYEPDATLDADARALTFPGLDSTLFAETACPLLDRAHLTDHTLQQVLAHLCFTREQRGRSRQSVSYATLGINQLGAVYEGLMAYRGFLATEELYELDSDGDPDTGTWVIPSSRADDFPEDVFVVEDGPDGQPRRVRYDEGDFVFRLASRDRQRSASYYTPEVLTEFTVRHTLDTYWDEHPDLTASDILRLTICEPALGSGAFLNEAINQLAARYLKAAQDESGETIDPERYQVELQKGKAHFAINQAYGVDLNPTAIELAEVSLWLNCMHPGLQAPRFGARLRHGNSLIGARRATYTADQAKKRPWTGKTSAPPTDQPLHVVPLGEAPGIHHFLLPGEGWGVAADATELKGKGGKRPQPGLAESWAEAVRTWRRNIHGAPTKAQLDRLRALARRVEAAWATAAKDVTQHLRAHDRTIKVWGADPAALPTPGLASSKAFENPDGPTARLRLLMDAWCALWLWGPANGIALPTFDRWLDAAELLLGQPDAADTGSLFTAHDLDDGTLDSVERFGRATVDEVIERHPWLGECQLIVRSHPFFHWELESALVRGSYDIVLGNPPWVRLDWNETLALAELDPRFAFFTKGHEREIATARSECLAPPEARSRYTRDLAGVTGLATLLSSESTTLSLGAKSGNLYLAFIGQGLRLSGGVVGMLHPSDHLVDSTEGVFRQRCFSRLRRMFSMTNELGFFEIGNTNEFSVNIYGEGSAPTFTLIARIIDPRTADRSLIHDGQGDLPGQQFADGSGWDTRPHRSRVVHVDTAVLELMGAFDEGALQAPRLLRPVLAEELDVLAQLLNAGTRVRHQPVQLDTGIEESTARRQGTMEWTTGTDDAPFEQIVLQGPFFRNHLPFAAEPRYRCKSFKDYDAFELESLADDRVPRTSYVLVASPSEQVSRYRIVWRRRTNQGLVRSLQAALVPPGPSHVDSVYALSLLSERPTDLLLLQGVLGSLLSDFLVKLLGKPDLRLDVIGALPYPRFSEYIRREIAYRVAKLNFLTNAYDALLAEVSDDLHAAEPSTSSLLPAAWTADFPARRDEERWRMECELDALVALAFGLSGLQLDLVYRSEFSVLRRYEEETWFDSCGRKLAHDHNTTSTTQAAWDAALKEGRTGRKGESASSWQRLVRLLAGEDVNMGPFSPPFHPADRIKVTSEALATFAAADRAVR